MKTIFLTKQQTAIVDDADYERVNARSWHYNSRNGYAVATINACKVYMHRFIMDAPPGVEVDHMNRNRLDNRRCNLRLATRAQQRMNTHKKADSQSQYKGVEKKRGRWHAIIKLQGQGYSLGCYDTERDAALAYDHKARDLFGEFANLNFPEVDTSCIDFEKLQRTQLSSQYKGVYYCKFTQRWAADVRIGGRSGKRYSARFDTEDEAGQFIADILAQYKNQGENCA